MTNKTLSRFVTFAQSSYNSCAGELIIPRMTEQELISIRVVFFAKARELAAVSSITLPIPSCTTPHAALNNSVLPRFPALKPLIDHIILAVNQSYVSEPTRYLQEGDELALIPPISGG
ncbi:Molybdopterin synthase sulfur carrier subunit [Gracilariopsis chorda]|uniref:Molybdopterin synthase sulfur carrier subunit n=1 Tax=Gracilariopsis chorda TaxID=448386 RepID=A0A2V3J4P2_9FLOR|nr:Molybdopterin synthase sulfur carrier subunit [Gracilariopsis chorda]|eukprot:PXF48340.1 Molybdopterin synthase sulfur carrier subunit [Gracilariopsis chorda]